MASWDALFLPGVKKAPLLDQPNKKLLNKDSTQHFQAISCSVSYLGRVSRYDILYAVNHLARAMFKPPKARMAVAKRLRRYLTWTTDSAITYNIAQEK